METVNKLRRMCAKVTKVIQAGNDAASESNKDDHCFLARFFFLKERIRSENKSPHGLKSYGMSYIQKVIFGWKL